jgi:hypothetical protein
MPTPAKKLHLTCAAQQRKVSLAPPEMSENIDPENAPGNASRESPAGLRLRRTNVYRQQPKSPEDPIA